MVRANGYVLLSVLWLLVVGILVATYLASWVEEAITHRSSPNNTISHLVDTFSTRSSIVYLLTSQRMTVSGLTTTFRATDDILDDEGNRTVASTGDEIRLDSRVYKGAGDIVLTLQDMRGLINLNYGGDAVLDGYLANRGMDRNARDGAIAKLRDYIDDDDLYRLNGAEKEQYKALGIGGPTNTELKAVMEIRKVIGWDSHPVSAGELLSNFTTIRESQFNLNSAPGIVLRALPDISVAHAQQILQLRRHEGIVSRYKLENHLGFVGNELGNL
jgi:general secretion pathway protein K